MTTTYRDYLWFKDDEFAGWRETGHVVSLIRAATGDSVLDALSAYSRRTSGIGLHGFGKRAREFELLGLAPMMSQAVQTVGVSDIGDGWVLLIQHNSEYLGVTDELFRPVIDNHEVVSHFSNVNANTRFVWWRGGQQQISFEPMFATWDLDRARSIPVTGSSTLYDLMSEVGGFQLEETDEPRTEFFHLEASFALAERITGIAVTKELIESAEFTVALVPTTTEPQTPTPMKCLHGFRCWETGQPGAKCTSSTGRPAKRRSTRPWCSPKASKVARNATRSSSGTRPSRECGRSTPTDCSR